MSRHDLLFSNDHTIRFYRHVIFWAGLVFYQVFFSCAMWIWSTGGKFNWEEVIPPPIYLLRLLTNMVYCYGIIYYLIPRFFERKRYFLFGLLFFILTVIIYILFLYSWHYVDMPRSLFLWNISRNFITQGPPIVFGLFLTMKILKGFYDQLNEKANLVRETGYAELQLLKSQVHPHFLFNTLNNIYSFTLDKPAIAADLVQKLSQTIKYMISDCESEMVSLEKELELIHNYIGLEKVRYGKRLQLTVDITGNLKGKFLAPLLFIPFVENSFKHGSSQMLEKPWIKIRVEIDRDKLSFEIINSKPSQKHASANGKCGIGLSNVQKRLKLIYPGQHHLQINDYSDYYQVKLDIPLQTQQLPVISDSFNPYAQTGVTERLAIADPM